jgi:predicted metalloendopeptidase
MHTVPSTTMALDSPRDYRRRTETANVFKAQIGTPIIDRRFERSSANRLKREVISLKIENQNLRQELIELQWQMQQQKMKILAALGESTGDQGVPEGFF